MYRHPFPDKLQKSSLPALWERGQLSAGYAKIGESQESLQGRAAYHAARPPHSEGLAVYIAAYLADETALPNVNLLHLSSKNALVAALQMADVFPHNDFRREATIGHLMLDTGSKAGLPLMVHLS